ncbi:MAG: hypothetical protein SH859_04495 [Hyphomicrobium aestuarii]|nr:hypothetical protein [Hyphomicrobium aestuarii]
MGQLFKILKVPAWLLLWASLAAQSANAQSARYPPTDQPWDGTSYRALVQRVEDNGLALPTLSDAATKSVFERMVNIDNIPLHMGLNRDLSVTIRFQRLDSSLPAVHKLVVLYWNEIKKGKLYAAELAKLMVYESKISAALLDLSDRYLATLKDDKRYQIHVAYLDQVKTSARLLYAGLVQGMTDTRLHSSADIQKLITAAVEGLPSYHAVLTDQDIQDLTQKLTEHINVTTDQPHKVALNELRDLLKNRRIRT